MSQVITTKCDICGRESCVRHYKFKKMVWSHFWQELTWKRFDICVDCMDEIRESLLKKECEK